MVDAGGNFLPLHAQPEGKLDVIVANPAMIDAKVRVRVPHDRTSANRISSAIDRTSAGNFASPAEVSPEQVFGRHFAGDLSSVAAPGGTRRRLHPIGSILGCRPPERGEGAIRTFVCTCQGSAR